MKPGRWQPSAQTYEEKREKFLELVRSLQPGITEIIFHPSVETEGLKQITTRWEQRVWEARLFADPAVKRFLEREGVLFTNWKEMLRRHDARGFRKAPSTPRLRQGDSPQ